MGAENTFMAAVNMLETCNMIIGDKEKSGILSIPELNAKEVLLKLCHDIAENYYKEEI